MRTFATMYGGGEGAGLGARAAGLNHLWGIEYAPDIAAVAEANGFEMVVSSTLTIDYTTLPAPFWLHASPPCVTASVANARAGEGLMDAALAAAVCEAIDSLKPEWFSLENVGGYRHYASYRAIRETLADVGYKWVEGILNAADYGVPQTRRRLFLIACRTGTPVLPRPTHTDSEAEQMQLSMFDAPLLPWVGWYEAIEDLIPSLPESKLAEWQLKRLPDELRRFAGNGGSLDGWVLTGSGNASSNGCQKREQTDPAQTIDATMTPKALLISAENSTSAVRRDGDAPAMAIRAGIAEHNSEPRALLVDGKMNAYGQSVTVPNGDTPAFTAVAQNTTRQPLSAVLMRPNYVTWESANTPRAAERPAYVPSATIENKTAPVMAVAGSRVVRLSPTALARLQGVPRDYVLPTDRRLAGRVIGNMVPPPVMAAIIKAQEL